MLAITRSSSPIHQLVLPILIGLSSSLNVSSLPWTRRSSTRRQHYQLLHSTVLVLSQECSSNCGRQDSSSLRNSEGSNGTGSQFPHHALFRYYPLAVVAYE